MAGVASFVELMGRVARAYGRMEREQVCCGDTTWQQFETLRILHEAPEPLTTGELSDRLGIDLSTASRNLTVLERNGYLRRVRDRGNARKVTNRLTAKGARCVTSLCCDQRLVFGAVHARIPVNERAKVIEALDLLARAFEGDTKAACAPGCCPPSTSTKGSPP